MVKSMNEIKTMRETSYQSPAVDRKNDDKNKLNESQSDYFNNMNNTAFRSEKRQKFAAGEMTQNSFFNTLSSNNKKKLNQRQKTLWDGVMHQKYLEDL